MTFLIIILFIMWLVSTALVTHMTRENEKLIKDIDERLERLEQL